MLDVLRGPDSARLFVSSLVGRTPAAAMGLIIVLRTKELTGSFASAGIAGGAALAGILAEGVGAGAGFVVVAAGDAAGAAVLALTRRATIAGLPG